MKGVFFKYVHQTCSHKWDRFLGYNLDIVFSMARARGVTRNFLRNWKMLEIDFSWPFSELIFPRGRRVCTFLAKNSSKMKKFFLGGGFWGVKNMLWIRSWQGPKDNWVENHLPRTKMATSSTMGCITGS